MSKIEVQKETLIHQTRFVQSESRYPALIGGLGCLPYDTEFLTPNGWKQISEWTNDEVLVFNKDTGLTNFEHPKSFIDKEADKFTIYKTTQFSMTVSPEHRILFNTEKDKTFKVVQQKDLTSTRINIPRVFTGPITKGIKLSDSEIRLMVCISADGYIDNNPTNKRVVLNIKKDRKKERLLNLLALCDIEHNVIQSSKGYLRVSFIPPLLTKDLSFMWTATTEQLNIVVDECKYWDGNVDKRENSHTVVSGTDKNSMDLIQYAFTVNNKVCSMSISDKRDYKSGPMYNVRELKTKYSGLRKAVVTESFDHKRKYCFEVSTGFFVVRQNNNIFITGNSGKTDAGIARILTLKYKYPTGNMAYYMPDYNLIRDRGISGVEQELDIIGQPYKTNMTNKIIELEGKGSIYFRSMDRPEKIVAYEVMDSIIDELDTMKPEKAKFVYKKIRERNRQKKPDGMPNTLGIITTPDYGTEGFLWELYNKCIDKNTIDGTGNYDLINGGVVDSYHLIEACTADNPFLPPEYLSDILEMYDPILANLFTRGKMVSLTQDKIYHYYNKLQHHTNESIQRGETLYIGVDFNVGGCACTVHVKRNGDELHRVEEFAPKNTDAIYIEVNQRYQGHQIRYYPDCSGGNDSTNASESDIELLRKYTKTPSAPIIDAPRGNGAVRDRINSFNSRISKGKYFVNYLTCPQGASALIAQGYDKQGKPEKYDDHKGGAIDDWNDASGYLVVRMYPIRDVGLTKHSYYD